MTPTTHEPSNHPRLRLTWLLWDVVCAAGALGVLAALYRTDRALVTKSVFDHLCFAGAISVLLATGSQLAARVNAFSLAPPVIGLAAAVLAATLDLGMALNAIVVVTIAALIGLAHANLINRTDQTDQTDQTARETGFARASTRFSRVGATFSGVTRGRPWLVSLVLVGMLFLAIRLMFLGRSARLVSTEFLNFRWGPQALGVSIALSLIAGTATVGLLPLLRNGPRQVRVGLAASAVISAVSGLVMLYEHGAILNVADWGRLLAVAPAVLIGGFSPRGTRGAIAGPGAIGAGFAIAQRWSDLDGRSPNQFIGALILLWIVGLAVHWLLDRRLNRERSAVPFVSG